MKTKQKVGQQMGGTRKKGAYDILESGAENAPCGETMLLVAMARLEVVLRDGRVVRGADTGVLGGARRGHSHCMFEKTSQRDAAAVSGVGGVVALRFEMLEKCDDRGRVEMRMLSQRWIPRGRISHPWPWDRFAATTQGKRRVR